MSELHSELRPVPELNMAGRLASPMGLSAQRAPPLAKYLFFALKLLVTAACFWYVLRQLSVTDTLRALSRFDLRWISFAVLVALTQLPLLALRLQGIVRTLAPSVSLTFGAANAVTAIYSLFVQVMPNLVGEVIRAWMLTRFGCTWRNGLTAVAIDRGAGILMLCGFAFVILLTPSALTALAGYRELVVLAFGAALAGAGAMLLLTPYLVPILRRRRYSFWVAELAADCRRVLLGPHSARIFSSSALVHVLTIVTVWSIARAGGLPLSVSDSAVLFTVVVGVVLIPISVGGWGLREFAVVSLLGAHGFAAEDAFLFSLCFGLISMLGALPGAVVYLLYPLPSKLTVADAVRSSL